MKLLELPSPVPAGMSALFVGTALRFGYRLTQHVPAITATTSVTVTWSGSDDAGGLGVASYAIFVSDSGAAFTLSGSLSGIAVGDVARIIAEITRIIPLIHELQQRGTKGFI